MFYVFTIIAAFVQAASVALVINLMDSTTAASGARGTSDEQILMVSAMENP